MNQIERIKNEWNELVIEFAWRWEDFKDWTLTKLSYKYRTTKRRLYHAELEVIQLREKLSIAPFAGAKAWIQKQIAEQNAEVK